MTTGPSRKPLAVIGKKPIESFAAIVLIGGGAAIGTIEWPVLTTVWPTVGSLIATLGGALFANALSNIDPKLKAQQLLGPRIESVNSQLAQLISGLTQNVQDAQGGNITHETATLITMQNIPLLTVLSNDLKLLTPDTRGESLVPETLKSFAQVNRDIDEILKSGIVPNDESGQQQKEQLETLTEQLTTAQETISQLKTEKIVIDCPNCGRKKKTQLGIPVGSTATSTCTKCATTFNVHRSHDGPLTRVMKSVSLQPPVENNAGAVAVRCTKCQQDFTVNFRNSEEVKRFCLNCCSELTVSRNGTIKNVIPSTAVQSTEMSITDGRKQLKCPECSKLELIRFQNKSVYRGVCIACSQVIELPVVKNLTG